MSYSSKKEFKDAASAMKKKINKKENKKDIMDATKGWDYGKHPQQNKKCKLGVQSVFQRLCSQIIRDNMKIPQQSDLHFCVFGKGNDCCEEFKWINPLFSTNHEPYFQFRLHQSIIDAISPPLSACRDENHQTFIKNAIWTKLNESSCCTKLIVVINGNGGEMKQSFYLKEVGRDTMTKNFDIHQINCRASYVPKDQKIAIRIQDDICMVLSGGIVGTGFCNLVKEEKKCKDDCHSIIHLLQEHKQDVDIKFFVKNGFNGKISIFLYNSGYTASLATSTKHESTDMNQHNNNHNERKEEYNLMTQNLSQSTISGRWNYSVDQIKHQQMKPQIVNTQQTLPMTQDNCHSTPSVCHSRSDSIPPELTSNTIPQQYQHVIPPSNIPSSNDCIPHNSHYENIPAMYNNKVQTNTNYRGHHTSMHCINGRHSPYMTYNKPQNPFQPVNHNMSYISLPPINETQITTKSYNDQQYLNHSSNYNNMQYNNNHNTGNNNNCFADDEISPQSDYPYQQQIADVSSIDETQAKTQEYVSQNNNNYFHNHNHNNSNNNCFAEENTSTSNSNSSYSHCDDSAHYVDKRNILPETAQQQLTQYLQPMDDETDTNATKNFGTDNALVMDIGNNINDNNNETIFETQSVIEQPLFMNNHSDLASINGTDYECNYIFNNHQSLSMLNFNNHSMEFQLK